MTFTIHLGPETARKLQAVAAQNGQSVERYLEQLAEQAATAGPPAAAPWTMPVTDEEWEQLLDEVSAGPSLPVLPHDLSRADLYGDHD